MMASLSEEEENYVRLALLLKGVSPRAVRIFFDREFPPTYLPSTLNTNYNTLNDLKLKRVLNQVQWNLLFPRNSVPDSTTFDVTLMICLIRNLTPVTQPINGFDCLPLTGETNPGSDLARIKWYRNKLAHHDSNKIDTAYFNTAWADISYAVSRLGGQPMNQECQELKVKILDQSNKEIMLEIRQTQKEMQELRQTMGTDHADVTEKLDRLQNSHRILKTENSEVTEYLKKLRSEHSEVTENLSKLQTEHTEVTKSMRTLQVFNSSLKTQNSVITSHLKDPIPWTIRVQIKRELEAWIADNKMFIETNGAKRVLKCTKDNYCVVVTGSSGTGKSSLVRHVALEMQKEGYDILPVSNPQEIIKWYNPSKKILFVVDDFCGTYAVNPMKFEHWKNLMEKVKALVENNSVKLIMSCRLQVYKDEKMKSLSFYQSCECNLLSDDMCLSKKEKQTIANLYLKTNACKINNFYDMFDCFPLLCRLCSKNSSLSIVDFFKNPYIVYKEELDKLLTEGAHLKYCALALCVIFDNCLKEEWLTEDVGKDIKTIIKNTCEGCKVSKATSRLILRDELDSLTHTFIRKDGNMYRTIHDKLFDFLAFYFGSVMIQCLIKNASSHFIRERFLFEYIRKSDEYVIVVHSRYQQMYINRMIDDWSRGNVQDVYSNINMKIQIFRYRFLVNVKCSEISQQKQLASIPDINNNSTPLIQCCLIGDVDMVTWCLIHCSSNINHGRKGDGVSPLISACHEGHTEIVQMLINNNAVINKCTYTGVSPLYIASQEGHINVVHILLNNKADINKCTDVGESPLFISCQKGFTEIVQMLINNKADINKCRDTGESPLFIACQKGHSKLVQILINNKADINKCSNKEVSPLFIACWKGHTEVVKIIINNKGDLNKCKDTGESPLIIACWKGHTEIVQMLIINKADIMTCNDKKVSPLYIACEQGYAKMVQMLIKTKADINKCKDTGKFPLFIACQKGHTKVVQILINNKADINKCKDTGSTPLFIACQKGHKEIVQMLIDNKADINKCNDDEVSPVYIACETKHIEVVQMLINNKADINKCKDTGSSPLLVACQKGHKEIVQVLINNTADINKCRDTGESPLFVACQKGHTELVQVLIHNKADINKCRNTGESPLFVACRKGHTEVVKMLINNKVDINKSAYAGESPIFIACDKGHIEVVQILINNKADINKCKDTGSTPLFVACQKGHKEIVQMLIYNKANVKKCRKTGESPLSIACEKGHTEIFQMLRKNKAIIDKGKY